MSTNLKTETLLCMSLFKELTSVCPQSQRLVHKERIIHLLNCFYKCSLTPGGRFEAFAELKIRSLLD